MKKIITSLPPFKFEKVEEVKKILSDAFGSIENTTEIIIIHDCKNPRCPIGVALGVIGTEEDEMIINDFIESEIEKDKQMEKELKSKLSSIPDSVIDNISKYN